MNTKQDCTGTHQPPSTDPAPVPEGWKLYGRVQCSQCGGHYFVSSDGTIPKHRPQPIAWERSSR